MEVEYTNSEGKSLCFKHAVKAVLEDDENISVSVLDNINAYDCFCVVCSKEVKEIIEDVENED